MQKKLLNLFAAMTMVLVPFSKAPAQRIQQPAGRGVVAVYRSGGRSVTGAGGTNSSLISWRKLAQEPEGTKYNVYSRPSGSASWTKLNSSPLRVTNFVPQSLTNNTEYAVTAIVNGVEGDKSEPFLYKAQAWPNVWFDFDFDNKVIARNDYRTKFVWPMDLDGNGEVDAVVVDRLYAGAGEVDPDSDDTEVASTTSHKIQAYKLDGTLLWTVDMGPNVNICSGQNDMVLAYDINCDGKCEVIVRSSDGTRFWDKQNETWGTYVGGKETGDIDGDGIVDYRTQSRRNPPFYISVIDGATGAELAYNELKYDELNDGSDAYGRDNRSDYMSAGYGSMEGHYGIAYLDGIHPSLIMECEDRDTGKLHHGYVLTWDFDWNAGQPSNWHHSHTWVRNPIRPVCAEFHQIRILDSDGDGCDEMWAGGYGVNPAQNRYTSSGLEHGDRFIIGDIDPERPGIEGYAIQQSALLGQCLYDAATGKRLKEWYLPSVYDVGRGGCMDIDPDHKGYEIYSFADDYIYNCKGEPTGETRTQWGIKTMFEGLWWNGDLLREELNSPGGSGYDTNLMVTTVRGKSRLVEFSQESNWATHGGTGTRPAFMGDIVGDWREEVILAKQNGSSCTGLTGYTTNLPTSYSIYWLQQDPHYRGDCTTRGYYQHPNTSFYLGTDMPMPPLPPVMQTDLRYRSGQWAVGASSFTSYDMTTSLAYEDGQSVIFDLSGDNTTDIVISGDVKPSATYIMNPLKHDYVFNGNIAAGAVYKSQQGTATLNGDITTTDSLIVSEGTLVVNGTIAAPLALRAKGTLAGNATLTGTSRFEGGLNYEGCRLSPGTAAEPFGIITFSQDLKLTGGVFVELNLQTEGEPKADRIQVNGNLTLSKANTLSFVLSEKTPAEGEYVLMECTGTLTADPADIMVRGLVGLNYALEVKDNQLVLNVRGTREPATNVAWTGAQSGQWDYQTDNFVIEGEPTAFVAGDAVVFGDEAQRFDVEISDLMVTSGVRIVNDSQKYTFSGDGGFSGTGGLVKGGSGTVVLNATKSDYKGTTYINGGTLVVANMENSGTASCLGVGSRLEIGKGTLTVNHTNAATNRNIVLTDTAAINIPTGTLTLQSALQGSNGILVKKGAGQLNINYGGTNSWGGTILEAGTLSQGAWNATLGKAGSTIHVTGNATVKVFNNNSTSAVPSLTNTLTVDKGKTLTIGTGQRCKVQGKLQGEGTVKISFPYVRGDFETNCSAFEGTLNPTSGQFRLSSALDLSKGTFELGSGVYVANVRSQSGTEESRTAKIGALKSAATDCTLSTGTWNVGYLGTNDTYAGVFNANATLNKYGEGTLTLTGSSAGPLNIYGGTVWANCTTASTTTGRITVQKDGTLKGNGQVQNVTVKAGGTLGALYKSPNLSTLVGTLTVNGTLTAEAGAILQVRTRSTATKTTADVFAVSGNATLTSPVFQLSEMNENYSYVPDQDIQIIKCKGTLTVNGDVTILPERPMEGYKWDTTSLSTDGIVRVVEDPTATGIRQIQAGNLSDDDIVADLAGRRLHAISQSGIYIVNGTKTYIRK